jgi:hypothetical protein
MKYLALIIVLLAMPVQAQDKPCALWNCPGFWAEAYGTSGINPPAYHGGTVRQNSIHPSPGNIYVPVPSMVYELGRGYVPSTGLAQVPGRQLTTPLGTALGYDNFQRVNPYGY